MLGTQRKAEHGVIQSSIALLQERFKHLQRVKEMREKRELLRVFSDYNKTSTTTSTTTTVTNNVNNNNNVSPSDSPMQYTPKNYEPCSHNTTNKLWCHPHDDDDDDLQIFLPPNYYNYNNKPPCYSSSSSSSSPSVSPSSQNNHNPHQNLNEVSLSLWPPMSCNNVSSSDHFRRTSLEAPVSTTRGSILLRPTMEISRPSNCVSTAFKFEDSHSHVSDVDTTLHL